MTNKLHHSHAASGNRLFSRACLCLLLVLAPFSFTACGKQSTESGLAKGAAAIKLSRQSLTSAHKYKHISDPAYGSLLDKYAAFYRDYDKLGDMLVDLTELNTGNKQAVIDAIDRLLSGLDGIIVAGDSGIKDSKLLEGFRSGFLVARGVLSSLRVVIAAINKPTPVEKITVPKLEEWTWGN